MGKQKKQRNLLKKLKQQVPLAVQQLESDKRLSECMLWRLLEEFYDTAGISAWNLIPSYPTSNAFIGEAYAEMVIRFLLDYHPNLNVNEPVYIVEMATGTGRFSYFMLKELKEKLTYFDQLKDLQIRYVMTDFTENNVSFWSTYEKLAPFRDAGMLDFAVFWPETQTKIELKVSQKTLSKETLHNPVIAIANYFFDSICQDLFRIENGQLQEVLLSFEREIPAANPDKPVLVGELKMSESYRNINADYYEDTRLNEILRYYQTQFTNASILFPLGAFRSLKNLQEMSGDKLVLISSDRGFTHLGYMNDHWPQVYETYGQGAFSYVVNYNAIIQYFKIQGGVMFHTQDPNLTIHNTVGVLIKNATCSLKHLGYYFQEVIEKQNPINHIYHVQSMLKGSPSSDADAKNQFGAYLSFLHLTRYDPMTLCYCGEDLLTLLDQNIDWWQKEKLLEILHKIRENVYPVFWGRVALNMVAVLYQKLDQHEASLSTLAENLATYGPDYETLLYKATLLEDLERLDEALSFYQEALVLKPNCQTTQSAVKRLTKAAIQ